MNTVKLAFRSILHFRTYSIANIIGLALSLACVITIFRYVYGEFTVDRFNKKLHRICLMAREMGFSQGQLHFRGLYSQNENNIAKHQGIDKISNFILYDNDNIEVDGRIYNTTVIAADSNFLKILDFPVVSGKEDLINPPNALITQSFAKKVFGNQNPVGKNFRNSNGDILTVTGVVGQTSTKSTLTFDMIVSYHLDNPNSGIKSTHTFILLNQGIDYRSINKQYETFIDRSEYSERYQLYPLSKVYFYAKEMSSEGLFKHGNRNHVNIFLAVGFLILLTGIINYINIYTVIVLRRSREFGVKKVFGAGMSNIFLQLLTENYLLTGFSLFAALIVANLASPFIVNILQLYQVSGIRFNILLSFLLTVSLPLITTLFPFLRHHYSATVNSLRNLGKIRDTGRLRSIFLLLQYIITFVLVIVSLFFVKQLRFMTDYDLGFRTKDIIKVSFKKPIEERINYAQEDLIPTGDGGYRIAGASSERRLAERAEKQRLTDEITQKMNACPLFSQWTSNGSPLVFSSYHYLYRLPDGEFQKAYLYNTNENWLKLFDMKLIAGRLWDDKTDVADMNAIIVTESFLKSLGVSDFSNVLLEAKRPPYRDNDLFSTTTKIIGVIKDFNYLHLSQKALPVAMAYSPVATTSFRGIPIEYQQLIAAIVPGRTKEAIEFLRKLHEETVGGEFTYSFLEDEIRETYREDEKIAKIYSVFTFIAIFISSLGLFSMSLFDIQQRRKEIAIRKINGATFQDIIRMLLKKYFLTLAVSFVIAVPIALLAISRYLEDFANKAPVSWWLFAVALLITAGISLLTLVWQTGKAAEENPAEVVKGS